jgi:hypothetical protein
MSERKNYTRILQSAVTTSTSLDKNEQSIEDMSRGTDSHVRFARLFVGDKMNSIST